MTPAFPDFPTVPPLIPGGYRLPTISLVAVGIVLAYTCLTLAATSCIPDLAPPKSGHHHHKQDGVTHAPLCAWACQANASPALTSSPTTATVLRFYVGILTAPPSQHDLLSPFSVGARSPPQTLSL